MSWRITNDCTIYREKGWYAAHPNIVRAPNGDLLALFHRCPDTGSVNHWHPLFDVRACRSRDEGRMWEEQRLVTADPLGGVMDFGTHTLPDGTIFLHASTVALLPTEETRQEDHGLTWQAVPGIPFWVRSRDHGVTWSDPVRFPPLPDAVNGAPALHSGVCRSGLALLPDGRLLMPSKATDNPGGGMPFFGMLRISRDMGASWDYGGRITHDPATHFSEPAIIRTAAGRLLVLFRCHAQNPADPEGGTYLARVVSDDDGRTWSPWRHTTIRGVNAHLLRLRDGRILVTVCTRHAGQMGCTARVLNPEGDDLDTVADIVVRGDSSSTDCGYPWAVELADGRVLIIYYYAYPDGSRGIEGTVLEERRDRRKSAATMNIHSDNRSGSGLLPHVVQRRGAGET